MKLYFDSLYNFETICELLTQPELIEKWDKTVESCTRISKFSENVDLTHTINSASFLLKEREFIEKRFLIPWKNDKNKKLIMYSSSLPEKFWPDKTSKIKGQRLFRLCIITYNYKTECTSIVIYDQSKLECEDYEEHLRLSMTSTVDKMHRNLVNYMNMEIDDQDITL